MLKSKSFVMGLKSPLPPYALVVGVSHLVLLGGLGASLIQQRQLGQQLAELADLVEAQQRTSGGGDPGGGKSEGIVFFDTRPPSSPEVGTVSRLNQSDSYILGLHWLIWLIITLVFLLIVGTVLHRLQSQDPVVQRPTSPVQQREVAQRQLAELRLRRHGFGQSSGVAGV